jgi:hypothetical protein
LVHKAEVFAALHAAANKPDAAQPPPVTSSARLDDHRDHRKTRQTTRTAPAAGIFTTAHPGPAAKPATITGG